MGFVSDLKIEHNKPTPEILAELVHSVYKAIPLMQFANLVNSSLIVIMLSGRISHWNLVIWYLFIVLVSAIRMTTYVMYNRRHENTDSNDKWRLIAIAAAATNGFLWALVPWLFWVPDSQLYQAFILILIAGMSAGATTTSSAILPSSLAFITLSCISFSIRLSIEEPVIYPVIAGVVTLFLLSLSLTSWRLNRILIGNIEARLDQAKAEKHMKVMAMYDELTRLPNRRFFNQRLEQEFSRAQRFDHVGALLFIDLDEFKPINDVHHHKVGDKVLQEVAGRLEKRIRNEDIAARFGGDEFVVLLPEISNEAETSLSEVVSLSNQINAILAQPYFVEGHELHISASIGIALFPCQSTSFEEVIQLADSAMYSVKEKGGNGFSVSRNCGQVSQ